MLIKFYKRVIAWYNRWELNASGNILFIIILLLNIQGFGVYGVLTGGIMMLALLTSIIVMKDLEALDPKYINEQNKIKIRNHYKKYGDNKEQEW